MTGEMTREQQFAAALAKFQGALPHVGKDLTASTGTYSYDYADLASIQAAALPLLAAEGFSFSAKPTLSEAGFVLRYVLRHIGGHEDGGDYPLPDPARSSPQQIGSAITYGRRYTFCAVTGIAPSGEDDDGQTASESRARTVSASEAFENAKPISRSSSPDATQLRKQIAFVGANLAMTPDDIATDFTAASGGLLIGTADPASLAEYLRDLQGRAT